MVLEARWQASDSEASEIQVNYTCTISDEGSPKSVRPGSPPPIGGTFAIIDSTKAPGRPEL
jgi:hypothetical protein